MLATQTLRSRIVSNADVHSAAKEKRRETYKLPSRKTPQTPIFFDRFNCMFHTMGIGSVKIKISVTMPVMQVKRARAIRLMQ